MADKPKTAAQADRKAGKTQDPDAQKNDQPAQEEENSDGRGVTFWLAVGGGAIAGSFILVLIIAIVLAIVIDSEGAANWVAIIRDLFLIMLAMEGMVIMLALIVLILQVAALVNLLQSEIKPIVDNANETVSTVKGTAQFMSQNVVEPVMKWSAITAGVGGIMREALGIRRSLRNASKDGASKDGASKNGKSNEE
ncbi:MAG: hypothetical protein K8S97_04285 [Anaerolineae bacterium]|nr:hypothetical protein [Anaerolineae bacterium]